MLRHTNDCGATRMRNRILFFAVLILAMDASLTGSRSSESLAAIPADLTEAFRNLPDDVRIMEFSYDRDVISVLDMTNAELVARTGLAKPDTEYSLKLGPSGDGFLIATSTDIVFCNLRGYRIRNCFIGLRQRYKEMDCSLVFQQPNDDPPTKDLIICRKLLLAGFGIHIEVELFFHSTDELVYLGYFPKEEYVPAEDERGDALLQAQTNHSLLGSSDTLERCVSIDYRPPDWRRMMWGANNCERYRIDFDDNLIVHLSGRNSFDGSLSDTYADILKGLVEIAKEETGQ